MSVRAGNLAISEGTFVRLQRGALSNDDPPAGSSTRSELQIDGANAYGPATASLSTKRSKGTENKKEPLSSRRATAGHRDQDPRIRRPACHDQRGRPDRQVRAGRRSSPDRDKLHELCLHRRPARTDLADEQRNQVAWMTDTWRSTDGAAHSLNALYDQEPVNGGKAAPTSSPATNVFSPAPRDSGGPAVGRGQDLLQGGRRNAQRRRRDTLRGRSSTTPAQWAALGVPRYQSQRKLQRLRDALPGHDPRGGRYTLRMAFVQAYTLPEVEMLPAKRSPATPRANRPR